MKSKNIFIAIIILLIVNSIFSQTTTEVPLFDMQNPKYQMSKQLLLQKRGVTRTSVSQVLESELESENYIVGPGDLFELLIFGVIEESFEFTILPEGSAIIPTIGELELKGLSLNDAKKKIVEATRNYYIKGDISVHLKGLRKFTVYITGEVENPGSYFMQGSDRLSTALELTAQGQVEQRAGDLARSGIRAVLTDWAEPTRLVINHVDGSSQKVDITRFYRYGEKDQNPFLRGGDVIYVPPIDLTDNYIIIEGNIGRQGVYQLKENENIIGFLNRIGAYSKSSNLEGVILLRGDERRALDILNKQEEYRTFTLQNKDKIMIPTIHSRVYVRGEVIQPGPYPYYANYTAKDYIGMAGALDSADDYDDIVVIKLKDGSVTKGPNTIVEKGDTIIIPKRAREVFKDYMVIVTPILSLLIATLVLIK